MKKLIFVLLAAICSITSFGQGSKQSFADRPAIFSSNKTKFDKLKVPADTISFVIAHTNYCLNKFANENLIAVAAELVGAGVLFYASNDAINGIDKLYDNLALETALAGNSTEKRLLAERKYERKISDAENRNKALTIAGGAIVLGGGVLHIISYRWLKRAYIMPIDNGFAAGIKLKF